MTEQEINNSFQGEGDIRVRILLTSLAVFLLCLLFTTAGLLIGAQWSYTTEVKKKGYQKIEYGKAVKCGCDTIKIKEFRELFKQR